MEHYIGVHTMLFGICVALAIEFVLAMMVITFIVMPNKAVASKMSNVNSWTPEMLYLANSRLALGLVIGITVGALIAILIYAPWRV
jgi:Sec-independent protein secretion pathway component TatC